MYGWIDDAAIVSRDEWLREHLQRLEQDDRAVGAKSVEMTWPPSSAWSPAEARWQGRRAAPVGASSASGQSSAEQSVTTLYGVEQISTLVLVGGATTLTLAPS